MSFEKPGILGGFVYGTAALLASWMLSGCRLGNYSSQPIDKDPTGYYQINAGSLGFSTNVRDGAFAAAVTEIPLEVSEAMANPTILQVQDMSSGLSVMGSVDRAYQVQLGNDDTIWSIRSQDFGPFWTDANCTLMKSLEIDGSITRFTTQQNGPSGLPLSGKMKAKFTVINSLQGSCAQTMADVQSCYADQDLCGGANATENQDYHESIRSYFAPWINSGSISDSELHNVRSFSFEAIYD
ncbi:MAG: hypothetical protein JNL01_07825 [Bdellovibrionales bacterium]|nr:hypothetical protein [Bdellovibrionales bacterium]